MKILRIVSRIIVGLVFIFSGTVKAIDPLGSAYKFHDYFQAFHIGFLDFMALPLAILLCTAEFITGLSVFTGFRQKAGVWGVTILMLIFTPLTFILALTNPVSDCGCFGDAIHLTNWQTFGKNIILFVLTLILFINRNKFKSLFRSFTEWSVLFCFTVLFVVFSLLNLRFLPLIDFLPYKTGINIPEKMKVPQGMPVDEYKTTFIYEKDGLKKEFTLDNYPANDSTWIFIDQRSKLVKKGYQPPIHDFSISNNEEEDLTEKILIDRSYSLLMISKRLDEADGDKLEKGFEIGFQCIANGMNFYVLTASGSEEVKKFNNGLQFCSADETTLKTMVRANPGYMLLREGTIIGKWSWANLPEKEWFTNDMTGKQIERLNNRNSIFPVILIVMSISTILFLLFILLKNRIYIGK